MHRGFPHHPDSKWLQEAKGSSGLLPTSHTHGKPRQDPSNLKATCPHGAGFQHCPFYHYNFCKSPLGTRCYASFGGRNKGHTQVPVFKRIMVLLTGNP